MTIGSVRTCPTIGRSALMYQFWDDVSVHDVSYGVPLDKAQEAFTRVMAKLRDLGYETPVPWGKEYGVSPKDRFAPTTWERFASEHQKVGAKLANGWSTQFAPTR